MLVCMSEWVCMLAYLSVCVCQYITHVPTCTLIQTHTEKKNNEEEKKKKKKKNETKRRRIRRVRKKKTR